MSRKEQSVIIRYGEGCLRVQFPDTAPHVVFLVRGLHDMSDVDLEGTVKGHPDTQYFYKAQAREAARSFAFQELMRIGQEDLDK